MSVNSTFSVWVHISWSRTEPLSLVTTHMPCLTGIPNIYTGAGYSGMKGSVPVWYWNLNSRGERGRKGRECEFQNKAHRTLDPRNNFTPVQRRSEWSWARAAGVWLPRLACIRSCFVADRREGKWSTGRYMTWLRLRDSHALQLMLIQSVIVVSVQWRNARLLWLFISH